MNHSNFCSKVVLNFAFSLVFFCYAALLKLNNQDFVIVVINYYLNTIFFYKKVLKVQCLEQKMKH